MNRRVLKDASRQCIQNAHYNTKIVTLVFLLSLLVLIVADWGLGTFVQNHTGSGGHYLSQSISSETRSYIVVFVISTICHLLSMLLRMGYTSFALKLSRGSMFSLKVLLDGFQLWGKTILLYLMVSVMLSLWASLFSIPVSYIFSALYLAGTIDESIMFYGILIYMAVVILIVSYRYRTAWFVLMDHPELPIRQIISQAKAINQIHRGKIFLLDLSFLPWILLSAITCGILLIWKLPYITATYAHAYNYMLEDYGKRQRHLQEFLEQQQDHLQQNKF